MRKGRCKECQQGRENRTRVLYKERFVLWLNMVSPCINAVPTSAGLSIYSAFLKHVLKASLLQIPTILRCLRFSILPCCFYIFFQLFCFFLPPPPSSLWTIHLLHPHTQEFLPLVLFPQFRFHFLPLFARFVNPVYFILNVYPPLTTLPHIRKISPKGTQRSTP